MLKPITRECVGDYFESESEAKDFCNEINDRFSGKNMTLTPFATPNYEAVRQNEEEDYYYQNQISPFKYDLNRVIFSEAFERLARKTQAITSPRRDHILNRMVHSQRVGEISAYIARCIGANEDLARAIGFAHDIGHAPLGHTGEMYISGAVGCLGRDVFENVGVFMHNVQGVNVVDRVACMMGQNKGSGLNLTDQVRHGILTHDGESDFVDVEPDRNLTPETLGYKIDEYIDAVIKKSSNIVFDFDMNSTDSVTKFMGAVKKSVKEVEIKPATIEACIVLLVDTLHYAPEDFADLVALGVVDKGDLPIEVAQKLGDNRGDIMKSLIIDIIVNSYGKDMITYSKEVADILIDFKRNFLYPNYRVVNSWIESEDEGGRYTGGPKGDMLKRVKLLFEDSLKALKDSETYSDSPIIKGYMEGRDVSSYMEKLRERHGKYCNEQAVVDFVGGCTDSYFFALSEDLFKKQGG